MKKGKQLAAFIAALMMMFSLTVMVFAEGEPEEPGLCANHPQHNETCGYVEGSEATPCTHEHDDACGFVEAVEGAPCTFAHEHNEECGYDGLDEATCTFNPASHEHDETCGYVEAVEGQPCTHQHSAECGYAEALEAAPCTHACELCELAIATESAPLMVPAALNGVAPMALPTSAVGAVWDGVDFSALAGSGIYYGTYKHATALQDGGGTYGPVTGRDIDARPVLWRVMGEEGTDGNLTMLSEYVLDSAAFQAAGISHVYDTSDIKSTLDTMAGGMFSAGETAQTVPTDVITQMFKWNAGSTELTGPQHGANYPVTSTGQTLYLLTGNSAYNTVFWNAGRQENGALLSSKAATLRNGTAVLWWLRSPDSYYSNVALSVNGSGNVGGDFVYDALGVRPAFQLNPKSVIFTSVILDDPSGNAGATQSVSDIYAEGVAQNFKLTVLNAALDADFTAASQTVNASTHPTISAQPGGTVAVALSGGSAPIGANSMAYKIVDSSRAIVGYGTTYRDTDSTSSITVDAKDLAGNNLTAGNYTVYVWEQTGNAQNSHEGGTPRYFTLNVDNSAPELTAGAVERTSDTAATVKFTSTGAGNYYYTVVNSGAAAPTIDTSGTGIAIAANAEATITNPAGLTAGAKDIYIAVKDSMGNIGADILKIPIPAYVPPVAPGTTYKEWTDPATGIRVGGTFMDTGIPANLVVTALPDTDANYKALLVDGKDAVAAYEVHFDGPYTLATGQKLTVTFLVNTSLNGQQILLRHKLADGTVEEFTPKVQNGAVSITVSELSPFMLLKDKVTPTPDQPTPAADVPTPTEVAATPTSPQTGDSTPFGTLVAILVSSGATAAALLLMRKR